MLLRHVRSRYIARGCIALWERHTGLRTGPTDALRSRMRKWTRSGRPSRMARRLKSGRRSLKVGCGDHSLHPPRVRPHQLGGRSYGSRATAAVFVDMWVTMESSSFV